MKKQTPSTAESADGLHQASSSPHPMKSTAESRLNFLFRALDGLQDLLYIGNDQSHNREEKLQAIAEARNKFTRLFAPPEGNGTAP